MSDLYAVDKPAFDERHYTVQELGKMWNASRTTLLRWFRDEPGVLVIGQRSVNPRKRTLVRLRIPQHVADRVYSRHIQGDWAKGSREGRKTG